MYTPLQTGEVLTLSVRINLTPDPSKLYAAVSENGTRSDTWILESADTSTASGTRSIIAASNAVRAECRGNVVTLFALNDNGRAALEHLADQIVGAEISRAADKLIAVFPAVATQVEQSQRLIADSPVNVLRAMSRAFQLKLRPHRHGFLIAGMFGYEFIDVYETLPPANEDDDEFPDYVFWLPDQLLLIDHAQRQCQVIAHVFGGANAERVYNDASRAMEGLASRCRECHKLQTVLQGRSGPKVTVSADIDDAQFAENVRRLKIHIGNGDVYQIVASRTFSMPCQKPLSAYLRLREANPSPYMFYFNAPAYTVFGASPETCLRVEVGDQTHVEISPIAGTRARGLDVDGALDPDLDSRIEAELRNDTKEVAEHMMLVDLARNDIARVSEPGSMTVPHLLSVERYSHVMHLVSRVRGRLRANLDCLHAYVAVMNMGTLMGAPKLKAAELLRCYEKSRRGYYGGAVGYITESGEMDTAIMIRSALVSNGTARVRAGAGIVFDSDPAAEVQETTRKAGAVIAALTDSAVV